MGKKTDSAKGKSTQSNKDKSNKATLQKIKKAVSPNKSKSKSTANIVSKARSTVSRAAAKPTSTPKATKPSSSTKTSKPSENNSKNSKVLDETKLLFAKPTKPNNPQIKTKPFEKTSAVSTGQKSSNNTAGVAASKANAGGSGTTSRPRPDNIKTTAGAIPKPSNDKTLLNIQHEVRIHGFSAMAQALERATPKVKNLLLNECDLVMECRYCRNLFRSLPNFISHKLNYCKSLFHPAVENGCVQLLQNSSRPTEKVDYQYYFRPSKGLLENGSGETGTENESNTVSSKEEGPLALEEIGGRSAHSFYKGIQELQEGIAMEGEDDSDQAPSTVKLALEPIQGRSDRIVYQSKVETDNSICDSSNNLFDNRELSDRDTAILGPDGRVICTGTAKGMERIMRHLTVQIDLAQKRMAETSTNTEICEICKTVFDGEKALRQHRRDAPDCVRQSYTKCPEIAATNGSGPCTSGTLFVSPPKQSADEQPNTAHLVKQLFSKSPMSHLQRVSLQQQSPSSSMKASMAPKPVSPHKKIVSKAVRNLHQMTTSWRANSTTPPDSLKFPCVNCSRKFETAYEMSIHAAKHCTGPLGIPTNNQGRCKIGIEVRHSYTKSERDLKEAPKDTPSASTLAESDNVAKEGLDVNFNVSLNSKNPSKQRNGFVPNPQAGIITSSNPSQVEVEESAFDLHKGQQGSQQEGDQDAISNSTDSGVGSLMCVGDDNCDSKDDNVGNERNKQQNNITRPATDDNNCKKVPSSGTRLKRKQNTVDDRVLVPKNKNLKLPNDSDAAPPLKRASVRKPAAPSTLKTSKKSTTLTKAK